MKTAQRLRRRGVKLAAGEIECDELVALTRERSVRGGHVFMSAYGSGGGTAYTLPDMLLAQRACEEAAFDHQLPRPQDLYHSGENLAAFWVIDTANPLAGTIGAHT